MRKKAKFIFATLALSSIVITGNTANMAKATEPLHAVYTVDFFNNYLREEFTLSTGFKGRGNNLLYKRVKAEEESYLTKPEDPVRANYEFKGWYLEESCQNEWIFKDMYVQDDTKLYAKWEVSSKAAVSEPTYVPPSTVMPDEAGLDYYISSVMYFKIDNLRQVKVSAAAIAKLEANKDNVLPLMEYKVKRGLNISATYDNGVITVTCGQDVSTITVKNDSANLPGGSYETKASNYEKKALVEESYHVMLAGSSSIEFWETSKEDLDPIVSYNHGIGGTTIEQWDEVFNKRLVLPYKPKMVVYYVGINNVINSKESPEVIWERLENFFNHTHEALPDSKIQYILMNQLSGYPNYKDTIAAVNANAIEYQKTHSSWLTLINPGLALLKENGEPNAAFFRTDGLHLSYYGYTVWGEIIKDSIVKGLNEK